MHSPLGKYIQHGGKCNLNTHTDSLSLQDCGVKTGKGSWCDGEKQSTYTEELL